MQSGRLHPVPYWHTVIFCPPFFVEAWRLTPLPWLTLFLPLGMVLQWNGCFGWAAWQLECLECGMCRAVEWMFWLGRLAVGMLELWNVPCSGMDVLVQFEVVGPSGVGRPSKEENHRIRMNHHRRKESHSARLLHFGSLVTTHSYAILSYKEPSLLTEKE